MLARGSKGDKPDLYFSQIVSKIEPSTSEFGLLSKNNIFVL